MDDDWDETPSSLKGQGRGSFENNEINRAGGGDSGFGGGASFGFRGGNGFGQSNRGGGGSRGGGSSGTGCFKCGQEGHMARDCSNQSTESRPRGCYKCGEDGHMARDCPNPDSSRGGRSGGGNSRSGFGQSNGFGSRDNENSGRGVCYKCGEDGHMARECLNPDSSRGGRSGGGNSRSCFSQSNGFGSRDSENTGRGGNQNSGDGFNHRSGGFGSRNDEGQQNGGFGNRSSSFGSNNNENQQNGSSAFGNRSNRGGRFGGSNNDESAHNSFLKRDGFEGESNVYESRKKNCFKCGAEDHISRDCQNLESGGSGGQDGGGRGRGSGCYKCGGDHMGRDCTAAPQPGDRKPMVSYVPPPPPEDEEHVFQTMQKGINFDKYDQIPVECTGNNKPNNPLTCFEASNLDAALKANITRAKYDRPTPIQKWAIPVISAGRDLMGCAQTGSGKTAAFLLPMFNGMLDKGVVPSSRFEEVKEPMAIIVGPTRELVSQIWMEARKFAYGTLIRPVVVYGGVTSSHQRNDLMEGAHIVIGTPGRLLDFIRRGYISLSKVSYFVLDEADRMLDMGFKDDMMKLAQMMPQKNERQTLMFSATFPEEIQIIAKQVLNDYIFLTVGRVGGANTDIEQNIIQSDKKEKRQVLIDILKEPPLQRTLVFVEQKRNADFLAAYLSQSELPTTSIHGDREQREREEALRDFKNGTCPILVATSVAARGLDIPLVARVINFDLPNSIDEYVHRIGRTGRCGNMGKAISFFDLERDMELARPLIKILQEANQEIPHWLEEMGGSSYGVGGFTHNSNYGAKDTRTNTSAFTSAFSATNAPIEEDDDWN